MRHALFDVQVIQWELAFHAEEAPMCDGEELVDHLQRVPAPVVDTSDVPQEVVALIRIIPEPLENLQVPLRGDEGHVLIPALNLMAKKETGELLPEGRNRRMLIGRAGHASSWGPRIVGGNGPLRHRVEAGFHVGHEVPFPP